MTSLVSKGLGEHGGFGTPRLQVSGSKKLLLPFNGIAFEDLQLLPAFMLPAALQDRLHPMLLLHDDC
jgi:hypothetical protein